MNHKWLNINEEIVYNNYEVVNQSHYRPKVPRGFQEVKVPRLRDSGSGWW